MGPSDQHVASLATALGVTVDFLAQVDVRPAAVLYRSRVLKSARVEAKVRARLNIARLIAMRLLDDIEVTSEARFPDSDRQFASPDEAAQQIRAGWWLAPGPIPSLSEVIESAGGVVLRVDLGCDEVDAAYLHPLGDPVRWFFINARVAAGDRVRFSLGHELGHAVLHEGDLAPDSKQAERESNAFSGALLLPAGELRAELPRGRLRTAHLIELKRRWGVSMGAIAMRAHDIGAISRHELTAIWKEIGWRGYRTSEPVAVPLEQPVVFRAAVNIHHSEHRLDDAAIAMMAGVTPVVLAGLFPDYFVRPRGRLSVVGSDRSASERYGGEGSAATKDRL